ncbi:MAG: hypothetical protein AB1434_15320 [Pseudomonadota bacterium]
MPPVVPIVLYNGRSAWTAPTQVADLILPAPAGLDTYRLSRIATMEPPKIGVMAPLASGRNRGLGRGKNQVFLAPLASVDFWVFSDRAFDAAGSGRGAR